MYPPGAPSHLCAESCLCEPLRVDPASVLRPGPACEVQGGSRPRSAMGPSGPALLALLLLLITTGAQAGECSGPQPARPAGVQHPECPRTQPEGQKASGRRGDSDLLGQLRPGSDGGQSRPGPRGWGARAWWVAPSLRMGEGLGAGDGGAGEPVLQNLLPPKGERCCGCRGAPYKTPEPIGRQQKPTVVLLHFLQKTKCWKMSTRAVQVRHFPTGQGRASPNPNPPTCTSRCCDAETNVHCTEPKEPFLGPLPTPTGSQLPST